MREFTKSTLSLAWAIPLFGAKQMVNMVTHPTRPTQTAAEAFDAATLATGSQLGDMMQSMFQVGDDLQREMTDVMLDMLNPKQTAKSTAAMMSWSTEILKSVGPGKDGRLAWQELRNKLTVFNLVYNIPKTLNLPSDPPYPPLSELVARAYELDQYPALWAVEGLGHYYGDTFWKKKEVPRNALTEPQDLPDGSLTMLHAGLGMAIAQHFMKGVNHLSATSDIRQALKQIVLLCRENSKPGYEGATIESLGLISRSGAFYGETRPDEMVQIIGHILEEMDPEAYGYFWHGVGRSIYFSPINFLPGYGAIWHPVEMIRREAPDRIAKLNAFAGLSWGVTMVNIRHPHIVANLLKHLNTDEETEREGFTNGVRSGLMMRQDTTPDAPFIANMYMQAPDSSSAEFNAKWHDLVQLPCEEALQNYYPKLKENHHLGDIFQYRNFPDLMDQIVNKH
jgi:hypothetical protein